MKYDSSVNADACEMKYAVAVSHMIDLKLFYEDKNNQKQKVYI